jgi:hypothetical protein
MRLGRICQVAINECFAPPRQARDAGEGMALSSGIMFLMYTTVNLYIRNAPQLRSGAERRPRSGRMGVEHGQ